MEKLSEKLYVKELDLFYHTISELLVTSGARKKVMEGKTRCSELAFLVV